MRGNTEFISQSVAAKIIRELRSRGYGATLAACIIVVKKTAFHFLHYLIILYNHEAV